MRKASWSGSAYGWSDTPRLDRVLYPAIFIALIGWPVVPLVRWLWRLL